MGMKRRDGIITIQHKANLHLSHSLTLIRKYKHFKEGKGHHKRTLTNPKTGPFPLPPSRTLYYQSVGVY